MQKLDELKRLQEANKILNKRYRELGLKPLEIEKVNKQGNQDKSGNTFKVKKAQDEEIFDHKLYLEKLQEIQDASQKASQPKIEIKPEAKQEKPKTEDKNSEALAAANKLNQVTKGEETKIKTFNLISFVSAIVLALMFTLNGDFRKSTLGLIPFFGKKEVAKGEKREAKSLLKVISLEDRPVFIASGHYANLKEADAAMRNLEKTTGKGSLKISKQNNYYTIQIGPQYREYEDALVVFKELIKYPIEDISIKVRS